MESSDDSYCGCNCRCCFNELQIVGKTQEQCTLDCGCDCACCEEHEPKLKQYWIDQKGALTFAKELVAEKLKLKDQALEDYVNANFYDQWEHADVNKTGLIEIERMSQFYKVMLKDLTMDIQ